MSDAAQNCNTSPPTGTPVIVFGAGGFVGRALMEQWGADGGMPCLGVSRQDADLRKPSAVRALGDRLPRGAAWIIAAAVSPDRGMDPRECGEANTAMAQNLAELIPLLSPRHVTFLSSIDVYGRAGLSLPLSESSPLRPETPYAVSKTASEALLANACGGAGIPLAVLRLPGVYGPGDTHHGPVASFLRAVLGNRPVTIHGDGEQRRDLLYVMDIPRIARALAAGRIAGTFNGVTGKSASLNEMLAMLAALCGRPLEIVYKRDFSQIDLVFAPSLLHQAVPALSLTPLETGLGETYHHMAQKREGVI